MISLEYRVCGKPETGAALLRPFIFNGRVQARCGAQRSNVGCNPLLGGFTPVE